MSAVGMIAASIVGGLTSALPTIYLGSLVNHVTHHSSARALIFDVGGMGLFTIIASATSYVSGVAGVRIATKSTQRMLATLYRALSGHPGVGHLEQPGAQAQISEAHNACLRVPDVVTDVILAITAAVFATTAYVVVLARTWPWMGLFVILTAVPMVFLQRRASRSVAELSVSGIHESRRVDYFANIIRSSESAREGYALGFTSTFVQRLLNHNKRAGKLERSGQVAIARVQLLESVVSQCVLIIGLLVVVFGILHGHGSAGSIVIFYTAVASIQSRASSTVSVISQSRFASELYQSYSQIIADQRSSTLAVKVTSQKPPFDGDIEFDHVSFRYRPDLPWVLDDVSFTVSGGSITAFVGPNGSGKTTCLALLLRLYSPVRGQITLGGIDISTISIDQYRAQVNAVLQDFGHYELSLFDNITFGSEVARDSPNFLDVADQLSLGEVAQSLPHGWDTMLVRGAATEEGHGGTLSGGQWQRVAWARALTRETNGILVLDEVTSNLDPIAARHFITKILSDHHGETRIVAVHDRDVALLAHTVIVFSHGHVLEVASSTGAGGAFTGCHARELFDAYQE